MPAPHPRELRQRVVDAWENGEGTYEEISRRFVVGEASVSRWLRRARLTGSVDAKPTGGNRRAVPPSTVGELVEALVRDEPNWTTSELSEQVKEELGVKVSRERVGIILRERGFSFKRGSSVREPPDDLKQWNGETSSFRDRGRWTRDA